jgi:hypothetical protein
MVVASPERARPCPQSPPASRLWGLDPSVPPVPGLPLLQHNLSTHLFPTTLPKSSDRDPEHHLGTTGPGTKELRVWKQKERWKEGGGEREGEDT